MKARKIYGKWVVLAILALTGCTKDFTEMNTPYNEGSVNSASIPALFNNVASSMIKDEDQTMYVALFWHAANQQAVQSKTANYLNYISNPWSNYYTSLKNYQQMMTLINKNQNSGTFANVKNMATILMAAKTLHMLDYYGDMPYSKAGIASTGTEFYRPSYDKEADIYRSVLAGLQAAVNGLSTDATQTNIGSSDSFLGNDITSYKKFGNAILLRYAVRLYNKEQALASSIITDIMSNSKPLPNNQTLAALEKDNFGFWPAAVNVEVDYYYIFRETSVSALRMGSNMWNQMSSTMANDGSGIFDPRCKVWFMTNNADKWVPAPQNLSVIDGGNPYPNDPAASVVKKTVGSDPGNIFSAFNIYLASDNKYRPTLIITEADVHFLKAEIYQRGMGVTKNIVTAKAEYEAGIKASVDFWYYYTQKSPRWAGRIPTPPTAVEMTAMLTNAKVLYNGANDNDALTKIATQAWIATTWQPAEAWTIVRRTGLVPRDATAAPSNTVRLPYPDDEQTNNNANWTAVTGGVDKTAQSAKKLYWMP
ncbi:SusD/RagB family nutrient-binding outer membrane lipoprotein [Pedobacter sp. KR3-3]|uniref:SusD/RagB family nutrient-binding outer membrane lipoprotein n=1 Tax=Pedobacter albus TaxID=3113905 RepID=A0ABU7I782_9SPHI|nr:SusD/RagB family nutrient-binding outer membrane lipoprotein [Pedobacter sp. KR3-3]MEE1945327.1 SusD/RagB family nutrient-binding outer membrane lipoprotein [Pedobacter sp. KR3-3]